MNDWFTVEKIDCDTYVISENKREKTHCYLLIGAKKALLIDTGLGVSNIKTVVDKITELPLEVVSTHVHWDHIGGHKFFRNIAVYETEKDWLSSKFPLPAHNNLNIPTTIINEIDEGFTEIFNSGQLKQGNGIFKFPNFQFKYSIEVIVNKGDNNMVKTGCLARFFNSYENEVRFAKESKFGKFELDGEDMYNLEVRLYEYKI